MTYGGLFAILIFSYALFSMHVFAASMVEFHDVYTSFSTLFKMTLGSNIYVQLVRADPILRRLFYVSFMTIAFIVMTNLFVALINSNYDFVKRQPLSEWFDKDLVEHLVQKLSTALRMRPKNGAGDKRLAEEENHEEIEQPESGYQDIETKCNADSTTCTSAWMHVSSHDHLHSLQAPDQC